MWKVVSSSLRGAPKKLRAGTYTTNTNLQTTNKLHTGDKQTSLQPYIDSGSGGDDDELMIIRQMTTSSGGHILQHTYMAQCLSTNY